MARAQSGLRDAIERRSSDVHLMCKFWYYTDYTDATDDTTP